MTAAAKENPTMMPTKRYKSNWTILRQNCTPRQNLMKLYRTESNVSKLKLYLTGPQMIPELRKLRLKPRKQTIFGNSMSGRKMKLRLQGKKISI